MFCVLSSLITTEKEKLICWFEERHKNWLRILSEVRILGVENQYEFCYEEMKNFWIFLKGGNVFLGYVWVTTICIFQIVKNVQKFLHESVTIHSLF